MEVVEKRGSFCHNLNQTFRYKVPTQEELRAFLFSESERFSTFVIKYNKLPLNLGGEDSSSPLLGDHKN